MIQEANTENVQNPNEEPSPELKLTVNRLEEIKLDEIKIKIEPSESDQNTDDNESKRQKTTQNVTKIHNKLTYKHEDKSKNHKNEKERPEYRHLTHVIVAMAQGGASGGGEGGDRNGFIALVLIIVSVCLMLNVIFVFMSTIIQPIQDLLKNSITRLVMVAVGGIGLIILSYGIACVPMCGKAPCNYVCLCLFVFFYTLILVVLVYVTKFVIVAFALGSLIMIVVLGIVVALFVPIDFTRWYIVVAGAMAALFLVSMILMLARMLGPASIKKELTWIKLIVVIITIVVMTIMFIIEIQMILGGRTVEMDDDSFVLGAILVYTSIIQLFMQLVQCMGMCENLGICSLDDVL